MLIVMVIMVYDHHHCLCTRWNCWHKGPVAATPNLMIIILIFSFIIMIVAILIVTILINDQWSMISDHDLDHHLLCNGQSYWQKEHLIMIITIFKMVMVINIIIFIIAILIIVILTILIILIMTLIITSFVMGKVTDIGCSSLWDKDDHHSSWSWLSWSWIPWSWWPSSPPL